MFSTILLASAQTTAPRAMAPPASLSSAGPEEEESARVTPGKRGTEDTSWTQVKGRREWVMLLMLPPPRHEFWRGFSTLAASWNHLRGSKSYQRPDCTPRPTKSEPLGGDAGSRPRQRPLGDSRVVSPELQRPLITKV